MAVQGNTSTSNPSNEAICSLDNSQQVLGLVEATQSIKRLEEMMGRFLQSGITPYLSHPLVPSTHGMQVTPVPQIIDPYHVEEVWQASRGTKPITYTPFVEIQMLKEQLQVLKREMDGITCTSLDKIQKIKEQLLQEINKERVEFACTSHVEIQEHKEQLQELKREMDEITCTSFVKIQEIKEQLLQEIEKERNEFTCTSFVKIQEIKEQLLQEIQKERDEFTSTSYVEIQELKEQLQGFKRERDEITYTSFDKIQEIKELLQEIKKERAEFTCTHHVKIQELKEQLQELKREMDEITCTSFAKIQEIKEQLLQEIEKERDEFACMSYVEIQELIEQLQELKGEMDVKMNHQRGENLPSTKFENLSPFPRAQLPDKLKIPDYIVYEGQSCPIAHLKSFCVFTCELAGNDGALIRLFQDNLKGVAWEWYTSLDHHKIKSWEQLAQAFVDRFSYMLNDVRRADLEALRQKDDETISDYVCRWRGMADKMRDPLSVEEQIDLIVPSVHPNILGYIVAHPYTNFIELLRAAKHVETGIHCGKILPWPQAVALVQ